MKILRNIVFVSLAASALSLMSCATTSGKTGPKPVEKKAKHVERELIDWKGAAIGQEIPVWVSDAVDGNYDSLGNRPELKDKVIFLAENRGKNLNILKSWTNNFDIQGGFGRAVSNYVVAAFGGAQQGSIDDAESQSYLEDLVGTFTKTKITGLVKKLDYWVEERVVDNDAKTTEDYFQYFVVYAMDEDDFRTQMNKALGKVDAKTEKQKEIKRKAEDVLMSAIIFEHMEEDK
ncbi:MAG: hypothetical protein J5857_05930 [Treponema sp.]|nr:hypothetical protein [Treponema sp.]